MQVGYPLLSYERKKERVFQIGRKSSPTCTHSTIDVLKRKLMCALMIWSLFGGKECDKLGQTQRQRQQRNNKKELLFVVHKVGIIEASRGAKHLFLRSFYYAICPYHSYHSYCPYHSCVQNGK